MDWKNIPLAEFKLLMKRMDVFSRQRCAFTGETWAENMEAIVSANPSILSTPDTMPPSIFGAKDRDPHNTDFCFYETDSRTRCALSVPSLAGQNQWIGAGDGWLVLAPFTGAGIEIFIMLNPLTKQQLLLPRKVLFRPGSSYQERCNFKKIIICRPPEHREGFFLVGQPFLRSENIAFLRPGEDSWKLINEYSKKRSSPGNPEESDDALIHDDHLYILTNRGNLFSYSLQNLTPVDCTLFASENSLEVSRFPIKQYLVANDGFLVMITRVNGIPNTTNRPSRGLIYRCRIADGPSTWERVSEIGRNAFFLGDGNSIALVGDFSSMTPNTVYFTERGPLDNSENLSNVGAYDVSQRRYRQFEYQPQVLHPIWIRPSFRRIHEGDLRDPEISASIASKLREFHGLDMPGPKKVLLWGRLRNWLGTAKMMCPSDEAEEFSLDKLAGEIAKLEKELSGKDESIAFCHNDLQYGNIMMDEQTGIVTLIDYEYASFNPVAYDMANHFCEMAANYHTDTPHILDYSKYPDIEERRRFVKIYLTTSDDKPDASEVDKLLESVEKYKLASHLLWGLWGIISAHANSIDFDYMEYARQRFDQYWLNAS